MKRLCREYMRREGKLREERETEEKVDGMNESR